MKEYFDTRKKYPDMPASQCLIYARAIIKENARTIPRYVGDDVTIELPHGEYIVVKLVDDSDADMSDSLQFETESARNDDAIGYAASGWMDREGRILFNGFDRHVEWQWFIDLYGFQQYWNDGKRHHSKHAAWLRARDRVTESFDYAKKVYEAGYVGYQIELHDADGNEIDAESCYGFENDGDYCAHEAMSVAEYMQEKRAEYWQTRVIKSRGMAKYKRVQMHTLIDEYRKLHDTLGDSLTRLTFDAIRTIRAEHSALIREIAA